MTLQFYKVVFALMLFALNPSVRAETIKLTLSKFTGASSLELRCLSGSQELSIPVPERWKVNKMVLNLHYTKSSNMLGDISQLVVKVNDVLVSQLHIEGQIPGQVSSISIPVDKLKTGYNKFTFTAAQHYLRTGCESACAPDLWTNISLLDSSVEFDYQLKPIPLNLGKASNWIFDPKQFPEATINMVADTSNAESLTQVGVAASGIARRFDYRKVTFSHSSDIKQGVDNILVGSSDFVAGVLAQYGIKQESSPGGQMRVLYVPKADGGKDGLHALIVLTGDTPITLKIAAETFANMSMPYPGSDVMHVYEFSVPDISTYGGRREIIPEKIYDLKTLGLYTGPFSGYTGGVSEINFRLPSDFLIKQNQYAKLSLNLSYGAGMRKDSTLRVAVNGVLVRDIHLDSPSGNYIEDYKLEIPTYVFKPGANVITLMPNLNTGQQACDAASVQGLFATVFDNSTFVFPAMPHLLEMARLDLFALNGFPFTRWPDGYQTMFYLPKPSSGAIDTTLNLIGMITQRNGFPLFGTKIVFEQPKKWDGELMVVGQLDEIPKSIMALAPLQPDRLGNVNYPISRGWDSENSLIISKQLGGLGDGNGLLMEFESGDVKGRSIVLVTAKREKDLLLLGDALLSPHIQNSLKGDVALIELDVADYDVTAFSVGEKYSTGGGGDTNWIAAFLYSNIYAMYALLILSVLLLGFVGYWLLRKYRAKRVRYEGAQS
ncbi:MAG: cellulose synthase subunit [Gallionellaceae bacterium]|nr:MAG: cellulose synthase subunit [Gallionellaceae bacterium]